MCRRLGAAKRTVQNFGVSYLVDAEELWDPFCKGQKANRRAPPEDDICMRTSGQPVGTTASHPGDSCAQSGRQRHLEKAEGEDSLDPLAVGF